MVACGSIDMNTSRALLVTLALVLIAGAALYLYKDSGVVAPGTATNEPAPVTYQPPEGDSAPVGMRTYMNKKYGFSLRYPNELQVIERKEGADADSITFDNADGSRGFQIFIVKYGEPQITKSRIDLDTKKGGEGDPVEIVLPATRALMFFSRDPMFGRLREVWFIRGGYLYEVTTYAELEAWLSEILTTLKFQ